MSHHVCQLQQPAFVFDALWNWVHRNGPRTFSRRSKSNSPWTCLFPGHWEVRSVHGILGSYGWWLMVERVPLMGLVWTAARARDSGLEIFICQFTVLRILDYHHELGLLLALPTTGPWTRHCVFVCVHLRALSRPWLFDMCAWCACIHKFTGFSHVYNTIIWRTFTHTYELTPWIA